MRICSFPGCFRPHRSNGLCEGHLKQKRRGVRLKPLQRHPNTRNVLMGKRLEAEKVNRLLAAAVRYVESEDTASYEAAKDFLLTCALTLTWKPRRAASVALVPAPASESVRSTGSGAGSEQEAA